MTAFRILLAGLWAALLGYTAIVVGRHGLDYVTPFFGDMAAMTWAGQFNADFFCYLVMSGLWTAWRNGFSPLGLLLGVVAFGFGFAFLAPYLLFLLAQSKGDLRAAIAGPAPARP